MFISWQRSPCPEWCVIDHAEEDHPDDRAHRDAGREIPVRLRVSDFSGSQATEHLREERLVLGRWQRDGESRTWYFLGNDHGVALELSEDSARRVAEELARVLDPDPR